MSKPGLRPALPHRNMIDVNDQTELKYWLRSLGVGLPELEKAIAKVGNSVAAVRKELQQQESQSP